MALKELGRTKKTQGNIDQFCVSVLYTLYRGLPLPNFCALCLEVITHHRLPTKKRTYSTMMTAVYPSIMRATPAAPTCLKNSYLPPPVAAPPILSVDVGASVELCLVVVVFTVVELPPLFEGLHVSIEIDTDLLVMVDPPEFIFELPVGVDSPDPVLAGLTVLLAESTVV